MRPTPGGTCEWITGPGHDAIGPPDSYDSRRGPSRHHGAGGGGTAAAVLMGRVWARAARRATMRRWAGYRARPWGVPGVAGVLMELRPRARAYLSRALRRL